MINNWTEKEDNVLAMSVKSNSSLSSAFREASGITGRSYKACSTRYYNVLKNDEHFLAMYVKKKSLWDRFCDKVVNFILK